jgi:hypothetical protein
LKFNQEDLVPARPWRKAVFTTYALSLSFFESVVLDGLVRGRTQETLILADAEGVRACLSEQGAQRAGRDYELEPVVIERGGVFHPKISAFIDHDDAHLVVGSGNLTFSGWGGNFEVAEHLHPSFAADAFDDAAMFFMMLAESGQATHGAAARCGAIADDLASVAARNALNGDVRLLHSLDGSIGERIADFAEGLGGATRLSAASPFWDSGKAVGTLCRRLGLDEVHVHAHPGGSVRGKMGANWPAAPEIRVVPVTVSDFSEGDGRLLHAKAFEVVCRRGRILVSGSANATSAALFSGNVEASVARIQRERLIGWTLEAASAPIQLQPLETDDEDDQEDKVGILRAEVTGETVKGTVLSPRMSGASRLLQRTSEGDAFLGEAEINEQGCFSVSVPGFELAAIRGGRVVLRIECGGQAAEGFASLSTLAGLRRIAGKSAASLLAVLSGTETPEDVRVLMEWAHDNPGMLIPAFGGGWGTAQPSEGRPFSILMADLRKTKEEAAHETDGASSGGTRNWSRFVDALLAAMKERRGPATPREDDEDEEDRDGRKDDRKEAARQALASRKALETFELVFEAMLPSGAPHEAVLRAFDVASYVCDRLADDVTPDKARNWLRKLVDAFCANGHATVRKETAVAAVMALCGSDPDKEAVRAARSRTRTVGGDLSGPCPDTGEAASFRAAMEDEGPIDAAWRKAGETRTWREQARFYCDALEGKGPSTGFEELYSACPGEAAALAGALAAGAANGRVLVVDRWRPSCPCRNISLPSMEQKRLKSYGVAKAANCCQRVLVWPEGEAHDAEACA